MQITQQNLDHFLADVIRQVFRRHVPSSAPARYGLNAPQDIVTIRSGKHIAAAFQRLRPFRHIPNGYVCGLENATLFLHRARITEHAKSAALELNKVKKPEWLDKHQPLD